MRRFLVGPTKIQHAIAQLRVRPDQGVRLPLRDDVGDDITVQLRALDHGGPRCLAVSDWIDAQEAMVVLNDGIVADPLAVIVLAHELDHLAHQDGAAACMTTAPTPTEQRAWIGASQLLMADDLVQDCLTASDPGRQLAAVSGMPACLARLRVAVALQQDPSRWLACWLASVRHQLALI